MVNTGTKLTLEEFLALPEGDVNYEFVDGQAVPKLSPKQFHSMLTFALTTLLTRWSKQRGRVRLEWAITLKRNGQDWAPVPDVTYISYERLPASWKRNEACPVPPELVIEVISPDQTLKEFEDKAKDYFDAGILRVWVVDPEAINIRVFSPDGASQLYTDTTLIIDTLLPGLELTPRQIFEKAELI
ncbi:MAG: Uma2 family endonuclease [Cyanobacteriota bacterium]